jgi:transposase-like protein
MVAMEQDGGGFAKRAAGEESEVAGSIASRGVPNPELVERPRRRRFSAAYKLRILREADVCDGAGEIGALLRREGLYSSTLSKWRKQREAGALQALDRKRGRKSVDERETENVELRRRLERTEAQLEKARQVIEVQGNVSALLGELLEPRGATKPGNSTR